VNEGGGTTTTTGGSGRRAGQNGGEGGRREMETYTARMEATTKTLEIIVKRFS
jgi:hypothetical protein